MNYQVLDQQQLLVFSRVYKAVKMLDTRWEPKAVLGKAHCCLDCKCSYLNEPAKTEFSQRLGEAESSRRFNELFAAWNFDRTGLALFGVLSKNPDKSLSPFVLLGEWGNDLPSYEARLARMQKIYRSWWPGRLLAALLLIVGIMFLSKSLTYALAYDLESQIRAANTLLIGGLAAIAGGVPAYHSFQKYRLLFRYHRQQPLNQSSL